MNLRSLMMLMVNQTVNNYQNSYLLINLKTFHRFNHYSCATPRLMIYTHCLLYRFINNLVRCQNLVSWLGLQISNLSNRVQYRRLVSRPTLVKHIMVVWHIWNTRQSTQLFLNMSIWCLMGWFLGINSYPSVVLFMTLQNVGYLKIGVNSRS